MAADSHTLWDHPGLRAALAAEDWGAVLRVYRRLSGLSQTKVGELVGLVQPDVSDIERGRRRVTSSEVRQRIASGLGAPAHMANPDRQPVAGLVPYGPEPDDDLLTRITSATDGTHKVDGPTLDWLDRLLAEHRSAEDHIGSRPLVGLMRHQLRSVVDLYAGARGPLAGRVVRLAAEHAQFLAWMAQDQGQTAAALAWYDRSHEWALEAGDSDMAATTLSMKAHMAWSGGHGGRTVRLAEATLRAEPDASLGVRAMAVQMASRGHALSGARNDAYRRIDEAQVLIARAAERPEDEPAWMYFYGETWFTLQRGMIAMHLHDWHDAIGHLRAGLADLEDGYRRDRTWFGSCLAHAYAGAVEPAEALAVALPLVSDASTIGRPHSWNELHVTAGALLRAGAAREGRLLAGALGRHG